MRELLTLVMGGMSLFAFCLMGVDKGRARDKVWRVPERYLWAAALLGGGLGAFLAMHLFHHKTKHTAFQFGFPLLAVAQAGLLLFLWLQPVG